MRLRSRSVYLYLFIFNFDEAKENECAHAAHAAYSNTTTRLCAVRPNARRTQSHLILLMREMKLFQNVQRAYGVGDGNSGGCVHTHTYLRCLLLAAAHTRAQRTLHFALAHTHTLSPHIGRKSRFHSVCFCVKTKIQLNPL